MKNPGEILGNCERNEKDSSAGRVGRLRGLLGLRRGVEKFSQHGIERAGLLDRLLLRLGLVRLRHVESLAEPTEEMVEKAYWILRNYDRERSDAGETLTRIRRILKG